MASAEEQASENERLNELREVGDYGARYERMRLMFSYYAIGSTFAFGLIMAAIVVYIVFSGGHEGEFIRLLLKYPAPTLGIPFYAITSLLIVLLLRTVEGPIEFSAFGFTFRGASGPIIMWVICFVAFIWATEYLWDTPGLNP